LKGPVEAFNFAVLPGAVGPDRDVISTNGVEGIDEGVTFCVGPVVVGHHLANLGDTNGLEELGGSYQESCRGVALFIVTDL